MLASLALLAGCETADGTSDLADGQPDRARQLAQNTRQAVRVPADDGASILPPAAGLDFTAGQEVPKASYAEGFSYQFIRALEAERDDLSLAVAAAVAAKAAEQSILPELWADAPDWSKRIEFQWELNEEDKPEFSVLTVQPLFQSEGLRDTVFTQARMNLNRQFGEDRYTSNIGLGYRRLFLDNAVLGGVNAFYDREWRRDHDRLGVGGEVKWYAFDLAANYYHGLGGRSSAGSGAFEEPLDGYNVELTSQVPFLPWARARVSYFDFEAEDASEDQDGYVAGLELDILPNLQLEMGYTDDDDGSNLGFIRMNFRLGDNLSTGPKGAYLISRKPVDETPFRARDMSAHTLDKVRRIDEIVVERSSSGITISRLN